jgi:hypothetical protein
MRVYLGDVIAAAFWLSLPLIGWWVWYTNPERPVKRK